MTGWDRPRPPGSAALMVAVGAEHGLPAGTCLAGTGLAAGDLTDPGAVVPAGVELQIVRNLQDALPDVEALGVDAGRRYHLTTHGIWGFALASSRTGWDALDVGMHFVRLTWAFCEAVVQTSGGTVRIVLDGDAIPADERRFLVQRELASIVTVMREVSGLLDEPVVTHLRQPAPRSVAAFTAFFGVEPTFGAGTDRIEVPALLFDAPLPQADPHTAALTREQCRRMLDTWRARAGVTGLVREALVARPGHVPGMDDVATALHTTARTLRRQLDAEGTSFRALTDEVRQRVAVELLGAGLTVEQTARRLGYAQTPAFTAAFNRWTGHSPRAHLAGASPSPDSQSLRPFDL